MPERLTLQELDAVMKSDPDRGLDIIEQIGRRRLKSTSPAERLAGEVTLLEVKAARERAKRGSRTQADGFH